MPTIELFCYFCKQVLYFHGSNNEFVVCINPECKMYNILIKPFECDDEE